MARLEHIGIAVDDEKQIIECFDSLLGVRPYKEEEISTQQVRTHFLGVGSAKLELLNTLSEDSPIERFLDRRGEGVHHLAFEVDDLKNTIHRLRSAGFSLLNQSPQPGADDKRIAFVHPKETHGVLVEFCETAAPDWSPRTVSHRDGHLGLYERGNHSQPPLLCLHDVGGSTLLDTAPLMRELEPHFHLFGLDLSGHGSSSLPTKGRLSRDRFLSDVKAALHAIDAPSCHLFGVSFGATVALQFAHRHPDLVERLSLFSPGADYSPEQATVLQSRLRLAALQQEHPEHAERLKRKHEHVEQRLQSLRTFIDTDPSDLLPLQDRLPEIATPTLVIGLDNDPRAPVPDLQSIRTALPTARLSILPGTHPTDVIGQTSLLPTLLRQHHRSS